MTQTRDLIKKMADFFTGEEFYEKGEDARLELSPDDVRCMNEVIKACGNAISRQAVHEAITRWAGSMSVLIALPTREVRPLLDSIHELPSVNPQEPSNDMVSREVFEQVMWERNVAIEQLKELGYRFGEKPKTGHWIKCKRNIILADEPYTSWKWGWKCSECGCGGHNVISEIEPQPEWTYCPDCGAKMVEPQESENEE